MPKRRRRRNSRLQDRDYEILEHIYCYRVSTRDILQRAFFEGSELNAVTKVTSRLVKGKFLQRFPLPANSVYFRLGRAGVRIVGGHRKCLEPLGVQSLFTHLALVGYCFNSPKSRRRMTVSEIAADHPELLQRKLDSGQYVIEADNSGSRLLLVRVDGGGTGDHVVRKIRGDINKRLTNPLCSALIQIQQFAVACVTYCESKKADIERRLTKENLPCPVEVDVVPMLNDLLGTFYDL